MQLEEHPTVKWFREQGNEADQQAQPSELDAEWLKQICLDAGADDVGFVEIHREALADQADDLRVLLPSVRTVVGMGFRVNRQSIRSVDHSGANLEYRSSFVQANGTARTIVSTLEKSGIRAFNPPAGFPYDVDKWPGKMWMTNDKVITEEAGLGRMGWNRLVLHPRFGGCMVVGTILLDRELSSYDAPVDYNPCIECKLCVSICPVGAVKADGHFDFLSCYTHNYREKISGFVAWVENVVKSKSMPEYRKRVSDVETVSMWQNLSVGPQTRCDRCMAVCPAGEEAIGEFLTDRKGYTKRTVKQLRDKDEVVYVLPGSDAEAYVTEGFPNKRLARVSNGLYVNSVKAFMDNLAIMFQRDRSEGLAATYHFTFTGEESDKRTVIIRDKTIEVLEDHVGRADLRVTADSQTWVNFLAKEKNLLVALLTRKIRIKGSPKLMASFAKCFPL